MLICALLRSTKVRSTFEMSSLLSFPREHDNMKSCFLVEVDHELPAIRSHVTAEMYNKAMQVVVARGTKDQIRFSVQVASLSAHGLVSCSLISKLMVSPDFTKHFRISNQQSYFNPKITLQTRRRSDLHLNLLAMFALSLRSHRRLELSFRALNTVQTRS